MLVRIKGDHIPETLTYIEKNWKAMIPWEPFDYHFLDAEYNKMYQSEQKTARLLSTFSTIAILLACLGLFGMTALITVKRTKEIGIRKVLGATIGSITLLLSVDFIKIVLIAIIISVPVAWYASERWLNTFAYRIDLPVWIFILAGIFAIGIALVTVSYQSVKAALTNPVNSLRNE